MRPVLVPGHTYSRWHVAIVDPLGRPHYTWLLSSLGDAVRLAEGKALRQLTKQLNVAVPAVVKAKPAIQLYIAQTITEHRHRIDGGV